jgi:hypothetical protein
MGIEAVFFDAVEISNRTEVIKNKKKQCFIISFVGRSLTWWPECLVFCFFFFENIDPSDRSQYTQGTSISSRLCYRPFVEYS